MNILLCVPASKTFYGEPRYPPAGIAMVAAVLRQVGYDLNIIDMRFSGSADEEFVALCQSCQPQLIGFTVTNWDVTEAVRLASLAKTCSPDSHVVFGGPQPTLCPLETMASSSVDSVCMGEGEKTILGLLSALSGEGRLSDVAGLAFRGEDGIPVINDRRPLIADLSTLPRPAYELFDLARYGARGEKRLGISSTRGCPYGCTFCIGKKVMGRQVRCRPPQEVVEEMRHWSTTAGITHFNFLEDNLLGKPDHGERLLDLLAEAKLPVTYSLEVGVRADALSDSICHKLKDTGCTTIAIGIESVDAEVLELVDKGEKLEEITAGIRAAKRAGLFVKGYFIVGLPGDTREKVERAVQYAADEEIDMPRFALAQAFPHTELAEWVAEHGSFLHDPYDYVLKHTDEFHSDVHYELPAFSREEIWETYQWAHDKAEALSFKQALRRRFGRRLGAILNLLNNRLVRRTVVYLYQKRLISLPK